MRGSQWEGEGKGPGIGLERILIVMSLIVAVSAVVVFYSENGSSHGGAGVTTVTTTGVGCGAGSIPQAATTAENDPHFLSLAGGLCYHYMGAESSGGVSVLTFNYYNGTIVYDCGTMAHDMVASRIEANVTSTGAITSVWSPGGDLNPPQDCPATPVSVVSVGDVSSLIPAVPELKITLHANSGVQTIATLKANLTLAGSTESFVFLSPPATLPALGGEVSNSQVTGSFSSGVLYPLTISGTYANGQAFTVQAYVEVTGTP